LNFKVAGDFMTDADVRIDNNALSGKGSLRESVVVASILAMTLAAYVETLWYSFVYDDDAQIVRNSYVQYWRHVPHYFISQVWAQEFQHAGGNYYRPLFLLWLRLNDAWFGLRPAGWHATAILLHLLATLLVYAVARKLTNQTSIAAFAALIFGLHPIHAEVVAWISAATESLCTVFVLAAFLAYLKSRENNAAMWMTLSCVLYVFAVFSKETGIVLPLLVFAHCWIYADGSAAETRGAARRFITCMRAVVAYVPVALLYLAARRLVLRGLSHTLVPLNFRQTIFSIPSMVGFYVKKWFFPVRLNEFYDMPYWGYVSFWHVVLPALVVVALCVAIWMARKALGAREVEFSLCWVIVSLLPVLDARLLPMDEMVHDRYFYLPSVGAALLVALVVDRLTRGRRGAAVFGFSMAQVVAVLALAATLGALTVRDAQYWVNDYILFRRAYQLAPLNPTARLNYGVELSTRWDFNGARVVFDRALAADPNDWRIEMNLARMAYLLKNYRESERLLLRAEQGNSGVPDVYSNLALTDLRLNRLDDALVNMRTAASLRPNDPAILYSYGVILEAEGNYTLASAQFRSVLEIRPGDSLADIQLARCEKELAHPSQN
jgi:protein O-mannosyl-transferase